MDILVIDVGGTAVKLWHTAHEEHRRFDSGKDLAPGQMVRQTKELVEGWTWEGIALGLPCRVSKGRPVEDPQNLGSGWVGYNFSAAFGSPARIMNDAALQALGSHDGGRMLFLGLGTAIGSAFIADHLVLSLDVGRVFYGDRRLSDLLGDEGFDKLGPDEWQKVLHKTVPALRSSFQADYVVLGGGSVRKLAELPEGVRRGHNRAVVEGGRRLWEELPDPAEQQPTTWIVL
jgi:hypothetical protein